MITFDQNDAKAQYRKIAVTIARTPNGGGNAGGGKYQVSYSPDPVSVQRHNAVLAYALTKTPAGIAFTGMSSDDKSSQFSAPTISADGSLLVFIDANTAIENIDITLAWSDNGVAFSHDPQVKNEGDPTMGQETPPPTTMREPQVKNEGDPT